MRPDNCGSRNDFFIYYRRLELHRSRRSWHESCSSLTCRRRKVNQLYCPKYWEFSKHVKCSGDFLFTINDLDFVVFVLYGYSFIWL